MRMNHHSFFPAKDERLLGSWERSGPTTPRLHTSISFYCTLILRGTSKTVAVTQKPGYWPTSFASSCELVYIGIWIRLMQWIALGGPGKLICLPIVELSATTLTHPPHPLVNLLFALSLSATRKLVVRCSVVRGCWLVTCTGILRTLPVTPYHSQYLRILVSSGLGSRFLVIAVLS